MYARDRVRDREYLERFNVTSKKIKDLKLRLRRKQRLKRKLGLK
jgi:hypothetical protein